MRYLITTNSHKPFFSRRFEYENHFNDKVGMVVYDLVEDKYTTDGIHWYNIEVDSL